MTDRVPAPDSDKDGRFYEDLDDARQEICRLEDSNPLAQSSAIRYTQVYDRLIRRRKVDLGSKNSAKVVRAALAFAFVRGGKFDPNGPAGEIAHLQGFQDRFYEPPLTHFDPNLLQEPGQLGSEKGWRESSSDCPVSRSQDDSPAKVIWSIAPRPIQQSVGAARNPELS
jgi:hypothetical protein